MTRGVVASIGLHVAVFLAVWAGPRPSAFEWEPDAPHLVELVAHAIEPPPTPPARSRPEPERQPRNDPPAPDPIPETEPTTPDVPAEQEVHEPTPVKPKPVRPPREFRKVAPTKRERDEPSLAERLQQRMESVTTTDSEQESAPAVEPEISPASEPSTEVEAVDFPFAWYLRQVQTRVRDSWDTPGRQLLPGRSRPVAVAFVIHRDGHVSGIRVAASSGSPGLDTSAVRAVERAQPFAPLPDPYEGTELALTIRFHVAGGSS